MKYRLLSLFFNSIIALFLATACTPPSISVENLRCEYIVDPLGIETGKPRFSWTLTSEKRGASQEAYLIIVSEKPDVWKGTHWDSGVHYTDSTINIEYQGKELESDHTYYWRVLAKVGNKGVWSKASKFHTGILKQSDWKAQWLSVKEAANLASPVFHNQFNISGKVKQAYVYTTAAGLYELSLNENKVGEDVLTPAVTDFRKTVLYSVYDVTNLLRRGMNTFRVMLGNGAYCMIGTQERHSWGQSPLGKPSFMLQMRVVYTDGSEQMVTSGEGWQYTYGPVTYNNLHGGEDYDARLANSAVINAQRAETVSGPGGVLCWQSEPIRVIQTMEPKSSVQPAKGVYLFDLGQNIAGWWRVTVKGAANKTIRVRGCETLNNSLFPKPLEQGDSFSDKYQYHSKVWTDYTMRGSGTEVYEPRFFYTGFRYIEVSTLDGSELEEIAVVGRVAGTSLEKSGNFTCSNQLINKIYNASVWSQKSNLVGYPTDCPHREKGAYNGDGQVIAETSMHDFNMSSFYGKWLDDMRDAQESNGRIPNTSPIIVGGMGGGVAWGSAYVLIPWWMYHYYNDTRQLAKHYPNMKKYIEYLRNLARSDANPGNKYIIDYFDGYWYSLGEWCSPGRTDCPNHAVVNTFYYYYDTKLMSQIALLLGHDADAVSYQALSDSIKEAYISSFFDSETALYGQDSVFQTYQLLPLITDLVPEGRREEVVKSIVEDVIKRDYHLNTGIIGTKYLWYVLPNEGYNDVAYKIATQETYPSYGYWIRQHCTTLLEKWEGYDSHNHQMFGTVNEYFYQYLAGIRSPLNGSSIAYKHIFLQPYFPKGLDVAGATLKTVSGEVDAKWIRKSKDEIKYKVTIPANTTATVILPESSAVSESGKLIWKDGAHNEEVEGISSVERVDNTLKISIQSGSYVFEFSRQ